MNARKVLDGLRDAIRYARGDLRGSRTTVYIVNDRHVTSAEWEANYAPDMRKIDKAMNEVSEAMDRVFKNAQRTKP